MRLLRRAEVLLDADVNLLRAALEPEATARGERGWLGELLEAETLPEEPARLRLAPGRCGELHVVDAEKGDGGAHAPGPYHSSARAAHAVL